MLVREKIASLDWNKRWNEPISLLLCSYFGEDYIHAAKAAYGIGFTHILFASRNGTVVCYRLESDTKNVGKRLAELFLQEKDAAHAWRDSLIQATDSLDEALSRPPKSFLVPENLHELDARLDSYLPVFIRVNIVPDFLPPDMAENAAAPLVEARAYAEHAYHAVEALFKKISEDIALKEKRNAGLLHNLLNEELRAYTETGKLPQEEDL
ncbi:MAG: hypothetical protein JO026_03315, partial [Patescibacteria group bacterium]|nr:hypothetical protein [Patescibacteria group bacterium]